MDITEVKVFPINEEKLKAFVSVVFDGCFMVNDIKVIRGRDGLFISMPSRKKKNGEFKDVAHPLNNDTRRMIETQVLGEYERVLAERQAAAAPAREAAPPAPPPREVPPPAPVAPPAPTAVAAAPAAAPTGAVPVGAAPAAGSAAAGGEEAPSSETPAAGEAPAAATEPGAEGKTLEEVEEIHLSDSFWTVT